jgi:hypothetical protein
MQPHVEQAWIVLGHHADPWGTAIPVGLPLRDLRSHVSVLGTTGSGKSTFLRNLALQAFHLGTTVVVIEPHGDLILDPAEGILAALPHEVLDRVTVVDLTSPWPPQLNLVTAGWRAGRAVTVATALRCIRVMEAANWNEAVRMREILSHSLHVLLATFGQTTSIVHLQRFLTDATFRNHILEDAGLEVGESRAYWQRLLTLLQSWKYQPEDILEVPLRRVGGLVLDERLRRSLALPALSPAQALDIETLLNAPAPQLVLVPLQAASLGEEAKRILGTLFIQLAANTFLARANQPLAARRQVLVIVDEFADLAGSEVGTLVRLLLAQARKFGAAVVLATQAIHQLPREVKDEVRSNTNIKVVLRTAGYDDAKEAVATLASEQLTASDVMSIERFHGYARVLVHGAPQPPLYFGALPPLKFPSPGLREDRTPPRLPAGVAQLERWHTLASLDPERVIQALTGLPEAEFLELVATQTKAGAYAAQHLLASPATEPDPVKRALAMSRARYGLPWWLYEAQYRRLRF